MAGWIHIRMENPGVPPLKIINNIFGKPPLATLILFVAVGIPTTIQFFHPPILTLLRRDTTAFLAGDWWRVITPLFVQDGGVSGSIFNLVSLFLVGSLAEYLWGRRRWLAISLIGGILSEVVAFAWQPVGAGNSVVNFALAAGIATLILARTPSRSARLFAYSVLGAGICLLILHDIHGAATALGGTISLILVQLDRNASPKRA